MDRISEGKARVRYEFGRKVSIAVPLDEGPIVGLRSFPGNTDDGNALALEQLEIPMSQRLPLVDRGYPGRGAESA